MEAKAPRKCRKKGCKLYPCDLSGVPKVLCEVCDKPIGKKPFVENRMMVRFGKVTLRHAGCDHARKSGRKARSA